jgi:hypothetical protein
VLAAASAATLAGCQSLQSTEGVGGLLTPYKMEIVQGNVITSEQAAAIKPGLSRAQVRDVLCRTARDLGARELRQNVFPLLAVFRSVINMRIEEVIDRQNRCLNFLQRLD